MKNNEKHVMLVGDFSDHYYIKSISANIITRKVRNQDGILIEENCKEYFVNRWKDNGCVWKLVAKDFDEVIPKVKEHFNLKYIWEIIN
ncbi:hypothetical protein JCM19055_2865 [Geomicrobium sp. JCM 19055]|nr:hypothetical protein JCM19055_2865 [Geomicrobium sp. JCM 19055]